MPGGDERAEEPLAQRAVRERGGVAGELAERPDRERPVVVGDPREVRAVVDGDAEGAPPVVARSLREAGDPGVVPLGAGDQLGEEREVESAPQLLRDRGADEPARVLPQEVDELGGRPFREEDEVRLGQAVRGVEDQLRLAGRQRPGRRPERRRDDAVGDEPQHDRDERRRDIKESVTTQKWVDGPEGGVERDVPSASRIPAQSVGPAAGVPRR